MIEIGPEVGWETRSGWHLTADILGSPAWKWQPTPAFSPGKSHGTEETDGPSSWGHTQRDRHDRVTKNCQYLMFKKIMKIYSGYQYNFSPLQIILYPFSCDCQGFVTSERYRVLICLHPTTSWTPLFCYPHGHWEAKHRCEQTEMKANTR